MPRRCLRETPNLQFLLFMLSLSLSRHLYETCAPAVRKEEGTRSRQKRTRAQERREKTYSEKIRSPYSQTPTPVYIYIPTRIHRTDWQKSPSGVTERTSAGAMMMIVIIISSVSLDSSNSPLHYIYRLSWYTRAYM